MQANVIPSNDKKIKKCAYPFCAARARFEVIFVISFAKKATGENVRSAGTEFKLFIRNGCAEERRCCCRRHYRQVYSPGVAEMRTKAKLELPNPIYYRMRAIAAHSDSSISSVCFILTVTARVWEQTIIIIIIFEMRSARRMHLRERRM